eukprot:1710419-Rhodomonas_salina.2
MEKRASCARALTPCSPPPSSSTFFSSSTSSSSSTFLLASAFCLVASSPRPAVRACCSAPWTAVVPGTARFS